MGMDAVLDDESERPTLPMDQIPTLPSAISVQSIPEFDSESERFFVTGALGTVIDDDDDVAAWWAEQRRISFTPLVAAVMLACVALLAACAR